ncbi:MAG: DUF3618 domain-containing protein [Myxococcaceae bacterium]
MNVKQESGATRTADQVKAEIERARQQIESSVTGLRQEMAMRTDWHEWVRRRPGLCLAAAFTVGFVIGTRK